MNAAEHYMLLKAIAKHVYIKIKYSNINNALIIGWPM